MLQPIECPKNNGNDQSVQLSSLPQLSRFLLEMEFSPEMKVLPCSHGECLANANKGNILPKNKTIVF